MSTEEIERRLNVWQALSELFLDTELDTATYTYVARAVIDSLYNANEICSILWNEVFPILESNLRSVTGVWEGYSREWLRQHLKMTSFTAPVFSSSEVAEDIKSCWVKVCEHLPSEYA
jgi:hypothetical protein